MMNNRRWQDFDCKSGNCIPGQYDCSACEIESNKRARSRLTPAEREYDRWAMSRAGYPFDDTSDRPETNDAR